MKNSIWLVALLLFLYSCTNDGNTGKQTRSDTITQVTNPGVGSVVDDTADQGSQ